MKRLLVPGLCALALGLALTNPSQAAMKKSHRSGGLPKGHISADSARAVVMTTIPDGKVKSHKLEHVAGKWVYSYDVSQPGKSGYEEVHVDAMTGEVISQKHESMATERKERAAVRKETTTRTTSTPADTSHH